MLARVASWIDRLSEVTGRVFAWLVAPLVLGVCYEVVARYAFNAPTLWAYDLSYMLYAGIFFLGAPYALRRGAHVRTDFLYNGLAPKTQGVIDLVGYIAFLPALGLLTWNLFEEALRSWAIRETTDIWRAPYYPLRWVMAVACFLLLLQSLAELARALRAARESPRP